jgi:hypothetical protein
MCLSDANIFNVQDTWMLHVFKLQDQQEGQAL